MRVVDRNHQPRAEPVVAAGVDDRPGLRARVRDTFGWLARYLARTLPPGCEAEVEALGKRVVDAARVHLFRAQRRVTSGQCGRAHTREHSPKQTASYRHPTKPGPESRVAAAHAPDEGRHQGQSVAITCRLAAHAPASSRAAPARRGRRMHLRRRGPLLLVAGGACTCVVAGHACGLPTSG